MSTQYCILGNTKQYQTHIHSKVFLKVIAISNNISCNFLLLQRPCGWITVRNFISSLDINQNQLYMTTYLLILLQMITAMQTYSMRILLCSQISTTQMKKYQKAIILLNLSFSLFSQHPYEVVDDFKQLKL